MSRQILLVDPDDEVHSFVSGALHEICKGVWVKSYTEAVDVVNKKKFDLFLTEVRLPDNHGFRFCTFIRQQSERKKTPVFFLASSSDITDKVMAFSVGADDYLVKPIHAVELKIRVEAKFSKMQKALEKQELLEKGDIKINVPFQQASLTLDGKESFLDLTPIEFKLLYFFMAHEGHVVNRDQLLNAVWGHNIAVLDRTVDRHISSLRKKLLSRASWIETIPNVGYRFSITKLDALSAA